MRADMLEPLRRRLLERRLTLSKLSKHALGDADELRAEREPDWEDAAALATRASLLDALGEAERREVQQIDEALARMESGAYGECVTCHRRIDLARLKAVPEANRCGDCSKH
jgi:DnaK suppressor protein